MNRRNGIEFKTAPADHGVAFKTLERQRRGVRGAVKAGCDGTRESMWARDRRANWLRERMG